MHYHRYISLSIKYLFCWGFLLKKLKLYEISKKHFSHKMCGNYIHSKLKVKKHFQHCPAVTYKDHCCTKVTKVTKEGIGFKYLTKTKYVIEDFNVLSSL